MSYKLPSWVVEKYSKLQEPFGFNGLGAFVYKRTYSRVKSDGSNENWAETVERVVNGTYTMQKNHVTDRGLGWDDKKADQSAIEMYDRIFNLKFTPPGRGLWAMGTKITEEKGIFAALNNCFSENTTIEVRYGEGNRERKYVCMGDLVDQEVLVCCHDRKVRAATIRSFGVQTLQRVRFKFIRKPGDRSTDEVEDFIIECTANHRWLLADKTDAGELAFTTALGVGDEVPNINGHRYKVVSIEPVAGEHEVYCATEPVTGTFCISRGIITGNCAFVSTKDIAVEKSKPFRFLKDMSMLGVGCGFDVSGAGTTTIKPLKAFSKLVVDDPDVEIVYKPNKEKERIIEGYIELLEELIGDTFAKRCKLENDKGFEAMSLQQDIDMYETELSMLRGIDTRGIQYYVIEDTREGWVESVGRIIDTYFDGSYPVIFDYSMIREAGQPLKTFGGLSSGPVPLIDLHIMIRRVMEKNTGKPITQRTIVDIMNLIGKCVVAGNVRRSSEISLGPLDSQEFMDLKDYSKNPERMSYGWCSNNSIYGVIGMDYSEVAKRIANNGEPGIFWMDTARAYSRLCDQPDYKDNRIMGTNPCSEQSLESYELCCLCEVFITRHDNIEDFLRTLKFAYLYAKTVTLGDSHWVETNRVMMRNRRIGCSLTGLAQFLTKHSLEILRKWCDAGYNEIQSWDKIYSEWLAVPRSVKTTSIKPSGCVTADSKIMVSWSNDPFAFKEMSLEDVFGAHGYKNIENDEQTWLKPTIDMWILNKNGIPEKATNLYINGVVNCYEIPLSDGSSITCTADHKFLVSRCDGDAQWIRADRLTANDVIVTQK